MLTIIVGSRTIEDPHVVEEAVRASGFHIHHIYSGGARGVDTLAERYARRHLLPFTPFPARWRNRDGTKNQSAGFERNEEMARAAKMYDSQAGLIAIMYRDEPTSGTQDMIQRATRHGLRVYVHLI